jgi:hypothetical protein
VDEVEFYVFDVRGVVRDLVYLVLHFVPVVVQPGVVKIASPFVRWSWIAMSVWPMRVWSIESILPYLSPAPGTISLGGSRVSCSFLLSRSTSERGMSTLKGTMSDESAMFVDGFASEVLLVSLYLHNAVNFVSPKTTVRY